MISLTLGSAVRLGEKFLVIWVIKYPHLNDGSTATVMEDQDCRTMHQVLICHIAVVGSLAVI